MLALLFLLFLIGQQAAGGPVILGGATTFIAVCGLINPPSESFGIYIKVMGGVIILGFYHGLVVLPVALILKDKASEKCSSLCCLKCEPSAGQSRDRNNDVGEAEHCETVNLDLRFCPSGTHLVEGSVEESRAKQLFADLHSQSTSARSDEGVSNLAYF